jgi:hypothetical protein
MISAIDNILQPTMAKGGEDHHKFHGYSVTLMEVTKISRRKIW